MRDGFRALAERWRRLDRGLRFVLVIWASSRALFFAVGALAHAFLPHAHPGGYPLEPAGILNYWAVWDGGWYSSIATRGYDDTIPPSSAAFFPLYPLLIKLGTLIGGGPALWGVLISVVACFFALFFLYLIAEHERDEEVARIATVLVAFFPASFFLNAVYTEALFLALTTGAIWALRVRGDLIFAGVFGYFATATRNVGIVLLIPFLLEWLRRRRELGWASLIGPVGMTGGLLAYEVYLWREFGDPLLSSSAQFGWGRAFRNPIETIQASWPVAVNGARWALHPVAMFSTASPEPAFKAADTYNFVLFVVLVALLLLGFRMLPLGLWIYSVVLSVAPILTPSYLWPLTSLSRYMLAPFPIFIVAAAILARRRIALTVWLTWSVTLAVLLTALFTTWRWVA